MGLFSFLSRSSGDRSKAGLSSKPGDRSSTVVRLPPARGGFDFQTVTWEAEESSDSRELCPGTGNGPAPDDSSPDDQAAPAPEVPRYREEDIERPSTASTGAVSPSRPRKNGLTRPRPLSLRPIRLGPVAPGLRPFSRSSEYTGTTSGVSRCASQLSFASSARTCGSRGFKDILDAQSEIRPTEFRARVRAAGARDYGEDVADRNMGENGVDLQSAHVQAFYARKESLAERGSQMGAYEAAARTRSLCSSSQQSPRNQKFPEVAPPSDSEPASKGHLRRHRSVNTCMPSGSWNTKSNPPLDRSTGNPRDAVPRRAVRSPRVARDSVVLAKERAGVSVSENAAAGRGRLGETPLLDSAIRPHRRATVSSASPIPCKRYSLQTLRSSVASSVASRDTVIHLTPLSCPPSSRACPVAELAEHPPALRTRSLRGWSTSSGTPTASDSSTTTASTITSSAQRSQSLRTADTSVDLNLTTTASPPILNPSVSVSVPSPITRLQDNIIADNEDDDDTSHHHHPEPDTLFPPPPQSQSDTFNIDDYLSSDDDSSSSSSRARRRPTAEGEEDLLFKESGYGAAGLPQLPGLQDPLLFTTPSSSAQQTDAVPEEEELLREAARRLRGRASPTLLLPLRLHGLTLGFDDGDGGDGGDGDDGVGSLWWRRRTGRMGRRFVLDTAADDEDEDEDGNGKGGVGEGIYYGNVDLGWNAHRGEEKGGLSPLRGRARQTRRMSALCGHSTGVDEQAESQAAQCLQKQQQKHGEQKQQETERIEGEDAGKLNAVAAVRLRKQVKRARRLAGRTSTVRLPRGSSMNQDMKAQELSVPVLRIEGETYEEELTEHNGD
ncbi:hypothetical protein VTK56DRAFT_3977 [Thermocarpiscus australiensis]